MKEISIINRRNGDKWVGHLPAYVDQAELPALLAALTTAAEEMGVSTVQGELVKALELAIEYMTTIACDPNHLVLTECRKALANVKR